MLFHGKRHPSELGLVEINAFLSHLAVEERVSPSTQNQALSALLFLYRDVLQLPLAQPRDYLRALRPRRLPIVLSRTEVRQLLGGLEGTERLLCTLLYGAGLRLLEGLRLRVHDLDFDRREITVRAGKGDKDRRTILPISSVEGLQQHLAGVRRLWNATARWTSRESGCRGPRSQVPERRPRMALAMGLSHGASAARPAQRSTAPPPPARPRLAA